MSCRYLKYDTSQIFGKRNELLCIIPQERSVVCIMKLKKRFCLGGLGATRELLCG